MQHKILIVDDDSDFLESLVSQFKTSQNIFEMVTAIDGSEALNILKTTTISLVVSDVQMPVMDGFILMAYIAALYPDIPVIMMNDPGEIGAEDAAMENGAVAYLEKPFTPMELLHKISDTFKKMSDGGQLTNVSLEMFIQLFEIEHKTCTVRVQDKATNKTGTLFFKSGELINARISEMEGNKAAYEILSWENISVSISDICAMDARRIDVDNQAVLLEAARRKETQNYIDDQTQLNKNPQEIQSPDETGSNDLSDNTQGGKLTNVSLETFIQLFEMEEKTCSLRVENPDTNLTGVLYFKNGELMDARLNYITGNEAALKILSWEKVSVEFGYNDEIPERCITGDLQAILLDAMRLRDELGMAEGDFIEEEFDDALSNMDNRPDIIDLSEELIVPAPKNPTQKEGSPEVEKIQKSSLASRLNRFWTKLAGK